VHIGKDIELAAQKLKDGGIVAIPTETVYGLAANALNPDAVLKIYEAKNRPTFDPLIVHVANLEYIQKYVTEIPDLVFQLAEKLCPGPLTFLLPKKEIIPDLVTSGLPKVGIRIPNHTLTLELLQKIDFPLAAPSANPFGYISPTNANHVADQLLQKVDYILDGGESKIGLESTIISIEKDEIIIHRLGGISIEELSFYAKTKLEIKQHSNPLSPGQLDSHYAPKKKLILVDFEDELEINTDTFYILFQKNIPKLSPKNQFILSHVGDVNEAAQKLFKALRIADKSNSQKIIAQKVPEIGIGRAINDRLKRAAH